MINSNGNNRPKRALSLCVELLEGRVVLSGVRHAAAHHPIVVASDAVKAAASAVHHAALVAAASKKAAAASAHVAAVVEALSERNAQKNPGAPPTTIETHLIGTGNMVTGIVITFSKPLNPATAQDPNNYVVSLPFKPSPPPGPAVSAPKAALSSVVYNPEQHSVTLSFAQPFQLQPASGNSFQAGFSVSSPVGADPRSLNPYDTISLSTITDTSGQRLSPGTSKGGTTPDGSLGLSIYGWESVPNPHDAFLYGNYHNRVSYGSFSLGSLLFPI